MKQLDTTPRGRCMRCSQPTDRSTLLGHVCESCARPDPNVLFGVRLALTEPPTLKQRFQSHLEEITNLALRQTCEEILTYPGFFTWPASLSYHHAYEGGLLAHTVEVCDYARHIAGCLGGQELTDTLIADTLIAAALWHDVMKTCEYEATHCKSEEEPPLCRHLVYFDASGMKSYWAKETFWVHIYGEHPHIVNGAFQFMHSAFKYAVPRPLIDAVVHCILAHHGRKEWGSPVEPQTLEALILHQADMLSAKFGATKDIAP